MQIIKKMSFALVALSLMAPMVQAKKKDVSADMAQAMKEVMKRGAPSKNHNVLKTLEGKWAASNKMWMTPGGKTDKTSADVTTELIHGGRFLKTSYKGDWNGAPYTGMGFLGYDNIREEYDNLWLDNFSTGIMKSTGQYDEKSKTLSFQCTYSCTMTGEKNKWTRSEWTIINKNKNVYKSFFKDPAGKEYLGMEITYTRTK